MAKFNPNSKEYCVDSFSCVVAVKGNQLGYLFANGAFEPVCTVGDSCEVPVVEVCEVAPLHKFLGYSSAGELRAECFRELSTDWVGRYLERKISSSNIDVDTAIKYKKELVAIYDSFNREY